METNKIDAINETDTPQASQNKKINLSEMNQTRVYHWINQSHWLKQGLFKELTLRTQ